MIILVEHSNNQSVEWVQIFGQNFEDYSVIGEVAVAPECDYVELDEDYNEFTQLCVKSGLVCSRPNVMELKSILDRLTVLGERGAEAYDLFSLRLLEELKEKEDEINALALTVLELLEV